MPFISFMRGLFRPYSSTGTKIFAGSGGRPDTSGHTPDGMAGTKSLQADAGMTGYPQGGLILPETDSLGDRGSAQLGHGSSRLFLWFFLLALIFSLYLLGVVMEPFMHSFIVASVFAALCFPFYKRCLKWTKGKRYPAAIIVLSALTLGVALPLTFFLIGLIPQASSSISALNQWLTGRHLGELIATYGDPWLIWLDEQIPGANILEMDLRGSLLGLSRNVGQWLLSFGTYFVANTLKLAMHFVLVLVIMFYFFLNGEGLVRQITYLCPLRPEQTANIIESLRRIARSVFVGGLFVATVQGIVGGIGLAIVGIPAMFWGTVMAFAALVPVVGTSLIFGPAMIYLLLIGETGQAIFIVIWCFGVVGSIDTVLRPILLQDGAKVPIVFLFLSILGGVRAYGMLGLLYGPMVLGLVAAMITIYREEYHHILSVRRQASFPEDSGQLDVEPATPDSLTGGQEALPSAPQAEE